MVSDFLISWGYNIYEMEKELDKITDQHQTKEKTTEEIGVAQVKKVFSFSRGNIAGFRVVKGKIKRNSLVQVWRVQQKIFAGEIKSLESEKIKLKIVNLNHKIKNIIYIIYWT